MVDSKPVTNNAVGHIQVNSLTVRFQRAEGPVEVLDALSFTVLPGEFVCLLGTSGCGKSTILNALAGFISPTEGTIHLDGRVLNSPGPDRGMVFQKHALFPWMTVRRNVEFGLKMARISGELRRRVGQQFIDLVGLTGFENRYPAELSGGMEQRVGLARVLALDPLVLLMDEPFGSLDAQTRLLMQELLLRVWDETKKTVVFVTHDVDEAILLADRIIVLTARPAGIKEQIDVCLPRPRSSDLVTAHEFVSIKQHALKLIREESDFVFRAERG